MVYHGAVDKFMLPGSGTMLAGGDSAVTRLPSGSPETTNPELPDAGSAPESLNPPAAHSPIHASVPAPSAIIRPVMHSDLCTKELSALRNRSLNGSSKSRTPQPLPRCRALL